MCLTFYERSVLFHSHRVYFIGFENQNISVRDKNEIKGDDLYFSKVFYKDSSP